MLTILDREEISRGLAEGLEYKEIARRIDRNPSIVSREVGRHGGRTGYRAASADEVARAGRERPKKLAVDRSPRLREVVTGLLRQGWSPASIAGRLPIDYAGDQACRVSHEAIYQWIYATPVSTLARELVKLRTGRTARKGGRRPPPAPRIKDPTYIDDRDPAAEARVVPGHWEGDLVIGKAGKTAVATLVERTSRFLVLVPLHGRDSLTVGRAVIAATSRLPEHMRASLTWDCGSEMADHASVTAGSGVDQSRQPGAQAFTRSAGSLDDLVEAVRAEGDLPDDEQCPTVSDDLQGPGDRTAAPRQGIQARHPAILALRAQHGSARCEHEWGGGTSELSAIGHVARRAWYSRRFQATT